ncbi:exodeoxyribonuclease V subunit beta [Thiohalocapsa marina]|uniref:RecBCD enzyme subunit RecB n=1 Tax=Thiohalocapsa marina TaxID=424902 RepID=A0A5M8FTC6_9GAMM|nr:exodeoxyribonuclease V subunit beta [Thiohalocapsa marina]KAA6187062.1 exodeoxyribonuclease V subunit beta [Thiohalocapsa marina]
MAAATDTTRDQTLDPLVFPLHGSRLIEASAGTGKTYTLALLYTRLVLGHGAGGSAFRTPLMPPNILVVTFTEAATKELRERIRARLVEAAEVFGQAVEDGGEQTDDQCGDQSGAADDPLLALRDSYPQADWPGCARRLRQAAEWMDEAMIATIHGWCQRMLQEHAFATRGLFQRTLVSDQTDLLTEILRDYWRVHFYPLDAADARSIRDIVASPEALRQTLGNWLSRRDAAFCYKGVPLQCDSLAEPLAAQRQWRGQADAVAEARAAIDAEVARLEQTARDAWQADRKGLETYLRALRSNLKGPQHDSKTEEGFDALLAQIATWAHGGPAPGKLKNFAQGGFAFLKNASVQSEQAHPAFAAIAAWQSAQTAKPAAPAAPEPTLEACLLAHAAAWVERELPRRLNLRAEMGFDELLRDLDAALTPADPTPESMARARALAATLRDQFPVALIDEFQDTDPVQYRIFDAVYDVAGNDPATALVMIGDPKQAIYGFRGADIHAYLAARRATDGRHYSLGTNFRSTTAVVDACNHFFGHAEARPRGAFRFHTDPAAENPIPYVQVKAKGRGEHLVIDGAPARAMTLWQLDGDPEVINPEDYRTRMATSAAAAVAGWLEQARAGSTGFQAADGFTPLQPKHIAILVRTGSEAAAMREALAALRINSVYLSDRDSVFETAEARDLLHWLRACAAPTDEGLVRTALATNTLAMPLEALARLQQDELAWEAQVERFGDYRRLWQRRGVLAMLHRLLHEQDLPARLLARHDGERSLTNLLHLAEWLQQSAGALDGEQALIRHLSEHLDRRGDEFIVRLESDAELIQVVTIHKSKGLEYPLVLLPFICSWREVDGRTKQVPYRPAASRSAQRALEVAGKRVFAEAWQAADDARLSEDMRLLYVAVTRARHGVWLGIAPLKSGKTEKPQLEKAAIGHVLTGGEQLASADALWQALAQVAEGCPEIHLTAAPAARTDALAASPEVALEPARVAAHAAFAPWWIASYSALRLEAAGSATDLSSGWAPTVAAPALPGVSADTAAQETALEELGREQQAPAHTAELAGLGVGPGSGPGDTMIPSGPSLHDLPRGSRYGTFLHGLLEWAAVQQAPADDGSRLRGYAAAAGAADLRQDMLARRCSLRGLGDWIKPLDGWLARVLTQEWRLTGLEDATGQAPRMRLRDLAPHQLQVEMEFWLESRAVDTLVLDQLVRTHCLPGLPRPLVRQDALNGMLKGFIDLVFEHQGRYYVLDWKSNWLGPDDDAYTPEAMRAAMLQHRYDLQYALYLLALHRQLRARLPGYDYDRDIGGAVYVFLRGSGAASQGLFTDRPPRALIEGLDRLFAGHSSPSIHGVA